jgi:hypothetical protein
MGIHLEMAKRLLFDTDGLHAANLKLFPGSSRDATDDQIAEQINKAIAQIEAGDYDPVEQFED